MNKKITEKSQATINQNFDQQQKRKLKRPRKTYKRDNLKTRTKVNEKEKPAKTTAKKRLSPKDKILIEAEPVFVFALGFAFERNT